ncbi:MAG: NUDIX hydrolase [Candidatus Caldatribacteriota bacterium]
MDHQEQSNCFQEETLSSKKIYQGKIINLLQKIVKLPDGQQAIREIVEHPGAVVILPLTRDKKVVMVRQFRKATEEILWELPAGVIRTGESLISAARRELQEETGYYAHYLKELITFFSSPGFCNERLTLFLARDLELRNKNTDIDEFTEVKLISPEESIEMVKKNIIKDAKSIAGIFFLIMMENNL